MSKTINTGWLTDFEDVYFAPKTLFTKVLHDNSGTDLLTYLTTLENNTDTHKLVVDLGEDGSRAFSTGVLGVQGILDVPNGGTGRNSLTSHYLLIGNGTGDVTLLAPAAETTWLLASEGTSKDPAYKALTNSWIIDAAKGPSLQIEVGGKAACQAQIPTATASQSGVVIVGEQTFGGKKTFDSGIDLNSQEITNVSGISFPDAAYYFVDAENRVVAYIDGNGIHAVNFITKDGNNVELYDINNSFDDIYDTFGSNIKEVIKSVAGVTTLAGYLSNTRNLVNSNDSNLRNISLKVDLASDNAISIDSASGGSKIGVSGVLDVPNGGTGLDSIAKHHLLVGNDANDIALIAPLSNSDSKINTYVLANNNGATPSYKAITNSWYGGDIDDLNLQIKVGDNAACAAKIPNASTSTAGVVTKSSQTFGGKKTFYDSIDVNNKEITSVAGMQYTDNTFYFMDNNENVVAYVNADGIHAINFISEDYNFNTDFKTIYDTSLQVNLASNDAVDIESASGGMKIGVTGTLDIPNGGTGTSTAPTQWGIIYAKSASAYASTGAGSAGQVLMSNGTKAPSWHMPTSTNTAKAIVQRDDNGNFSAGTITLDTRNPAIKFSSTDANYIQAPAASSINLCVADSLELDASALCVTATAVKPGKTDTFTLGTSSRVWSNVYATTFTGAMSKSITINNKTYNGGSDIDVGTIGVGYGGTGKTSWTANRIVYASSASALSQLGSGSAGQLLQSGGTSAPSWISGDIGDAKTPIYIKSGIPTAGTNLDNYLTLTELGTAIPENADLNTYTTGGTYYSQDSTRTGTLTNAPVTGAGFKLIVMKCYQSTRCYQFVLSNSNQLWQRYSTGSTWNEWCRIWREGNSVTGAVWNDYAECRESDCEEAGYVLSENGNDTLSKTTMRLSSFAGVSSDTWGFSQGQTEKAKTHIAVAGRVLAYTYQNRNKYKPGDCVCAAPGGTVDIMTREEVINYPDRIVGIVSCVPTYDEWGGGKNADRSSVKVNGRIWIKIR